MERGHDGWRSNGRLKGWVDGGRGAMLEGPWEEVRLGQTRRGEGGDALASVSHGGRNLQVGDPWTLCGIDGRQVLQRRFTKDDGGDTGCAESN